MNRPFQEFDFQTRIDIAAWILAGLALFLILQLGLLAALLAGLLVHELTFLLAMRHRVVGVTHEVGKAIVLGILASIVIVGLIFGTVSLATLFNGQSESLVLLLQEMANAIDTARSHLPPWVLPYLPANVEELESAAANWLRVHASDVRYAGERFGKVLAHILIGMIIGGLIALSQPAPTATMRPLTRALADRIDLLGAAFRRVVFGQVRISALNTFLTGLYLAVVLPALGVDLPLTKTMIVVTFVVGLLPVIGNLISNTVIVVVSISVSFYVAVSSLAFLVIIHKLEYFINARIIGGQIHAKAWELLLAMLVMEAAFGIPGVIAAPIFYAYLKNELKARQLI